MNDPASNVATTSSSVFGASTDQTSQVSSGYSKFHTSTLNPSERINPFDKNKPIVVETKSSESTIVLAITTKSLPSTVNSVPSTSPTTTTTSISSTSSRFDRYQEAGPTTTTIPITSTTSSYSTPSAANIISKAESSTAASGSSYTTSTSKPSVQTTTTSRSEAAKYAFGTGQYSTGSVSDSEIIFGSTDLPDFQPTKRSAGRSSFATSIDADSIYAPKRNAAIYNRSLSVSSDVNGDFASDPRVNTSYRIYEGIQNAAFQDFDSPVKTTPVTASNVPTTSHTTKTYTSFSARNYSMDGDDDDLK